MMEPSGHPRAALRRLQRAWWIALLAAALLVALGAEWLARAATAAAALRWAAVAAAVLGGVFALLRRNLERNHRPGETELLDSLGLPNAITLARGVATALFAGLLVAPLPPAGALAWAPAILYAAAVLPDFIDGALARATRRITLLGEILDMEVDCLAMLAVSLLAVRLGKMPLWTISLGLARYLFVAGIAWRKRHGLPVHALPPSNIRRLAAGFQMVFYCIALWPIFGPPATTLAGIVCVTPILAGFVRDWLVVSAAVDPESAGYRRFQRGGAALACWLPPPLRWVAAGTAVAFLAPALLALTNPVAAPSLAALVYACAAALALGIGARVAAIGLLIATCTAVALFGLQPYSAVLLLAVIPLLYAGAGRLALWRGEDALFARRPGEAPGGAG
jgi:CDP-diacylglycerol--glycerol-3-phosphate 3-phosphatidyltransferase